MASFADDQESLTKFLHLVCHFWTDLDCEQSYNCGNGVCIPESSVCDQAPNCGNGVDESSLTCLGKRFCGMTVFF